MPPPQRQQPLAVIARLLEQPHGFGFFQALRLLERWLHESGDAPASAGGPGRLRRLAVRNDLSMAFPPSEIVQLQVEGEVQSADGRPSAEGVRRVTLTPAFIGLLGAQGALPRHYTDLFAQRELLHRDASGRAFLDIFLHRATLLFYQAWLKHRLPLQYEADRQKRALPLVLALAGMGLPGTRNRLRAAEGGVADDTLAHFAGTLQRRTVSAVTIRQVLHRYFGVPVAVEQFVGRWHTLPAEHQSHLGLRNMRFEEGITLGERVWQRNLRLRLRFGPMPRERFLKFLPGGPAALALRELLQMLTGHTLEYEVRLVLRAPDVQGMALNESSPARLGWDSFLCTQPEHQDRSDVGYDLLALA